MILQASLAPPEHDMSDEVMKEMCDDMRHELWNCRAYHNFSEEDHMGVLKSAARQNAGKGFERKMLRSSLLRPLRVYLKKCCSAPFRFSLGDT